MSTSSLSKVNRNSMGKKVPGAAIVLLWPLPTFLLPYYCLSRILLCVGGSGANWFICNTIYKGAINILQLLHHHEWATLIIPDLVLILVFIGKCTGKLIESSDKVCTMIQTIYLQKEIMLWYVNYGKITMIQNIYLQKTNKQNIARNMSMSRSTSPTVTPNAAVFPVFERRLLTCISPRSTASFSKRLVSWSRTAMWASTPGGCWKPKFIC